MTTDPLAPFAGLIEAVAERTAQRVLASINANTISQATSPLGPRTHRAAVKRRLQNGEGGATIVGRRHLLTREALAEELSGKRRPPPEPEPTPTPTPPTSGDLGSFQRDLLASLRGLRA